MNRIRYTPCVLAAILLFANLADGQTTCTASAVPQTTRTEGNTELLGDVVLACTGGVPTPAGGAVPQINLSVVLSTDATSKVTASTPGGDFTETLLLVDEPNHTLPSSSVSHPLLNCGQTGAPDSGTSGPGVCQIVSTGNPQQTYDGTPNRSGSVDCTASPHYGCGRPNAFQGRTAGRSNNVVEFLGVPFDPPGSGPQRILRITNLRGNAASLASGISHSISIDLQQTGSPSLTIAPSNLGVAFVEDGLTASMSSPGVVTVTEGFASAWKSRNVAFTLANAAFSAGLWRYNGSTNYPLQIAQNVPGVSFNNEDVFQWQNNNPNGPPSPNPPPGFGTGTISNLKYPLGSLSYGGVNTGIAGAGVSDAGTRIALSFSAPGETITIPSVVYLHPVGSPSTTSGVMVLTKTDANGAGPFTPEPNIAFHNSGLAVYEVLYSDPLDVEYADIASIVTGNSHAGLVSVSFAPFYAATSHPEPTAIPRFNLTGPSLGLGK